MDLGEKEMGELREVERGKNVFGVYFIEESIAKSIY